MRLTNPTAPAAEPLALGERPDSQGVDDGPVPVPDAARPEPAPAPTAPAGLPVRRVFRRAGV